MPYIESLNLCGCSQPHRQRTQYAFVQDILSLRVLNLSLCKQITDRLGIGLYLKNLEHAPAGPPVSSKVLNLSFAEGYLARDDPPVTYDPPSSLNLRSCGITLRHRDNASGQGPLRCLDLMSPSVIRSGPEPKRHRPGLYQPGSLSLSSATSVMMLIM
ncbi:F-box/LRR-repeat protein 14-like protein [Lates japonicus]|uniref:F-box/LRR-repeat protein 14-like protein n=1 Tax=Lates japonicus TaxID=270547 RepID=A0AAD3NNA2_LATJO|nr:F-box/LRR-repeat protein 14-like protein [Lates japonicus]